MNTLLLDIRYGIRLLLKKPAMCLIVILTLGVGIGANTALFSAMNAFLLRPLPVPHADRLMLIAPLHQGMTDYTEFSYQDYQDLRNQTSAFSGLLAYTVNIVGLTEREKAQQIAVSNVSGNYFDVLGLRPALGRFIAGEASEKPGAAREIVLGYSFWKTRFNSDPGVIGQQVKVNNQTMTIIGVAPEGFQGLFSLVNMQAYMPFGATVAVEQQSNDFWSKRGYRALRSVFGIMKPGISRREAQSSIDVVMQRLAQEYPEIDKGVTARVIPEPLARPEPDPENGLVLVAIIFMALAGFVLLLACVNVVNILLVRATAREREMAVRAALGAARWRLVRQLMTETMVLAFFGGAAGILIGTWASALLGSVHMMAAGLPLVFDFSFDWRVFAFGLLVAIVAGVIVGLAPAWRASRLNLNDVLHEGSRGILAGTVRSRIRRLLVIGQVAVSLALMVVAGLFIRSSSNAEHVFWGFDPHHVLNLGMDTRFLGFDEARTQRFYKDLVARIQLLPGVQSVASASCVPMGYYNNSDRFYVEGSTTPKPQLTPEVPFNSVDPSYFATMRVPLIQGRTFTESDTDASPQVAIVNQALARRFWPNQDPLGKRFSTTSPGGPFLEVVGVVKDGKYQNPWENGLAFYFVPASQRSKTMRVIQVRASGDPASLAAEVVEQVHQLAPELPVFDVQTMDQALEGVNGLFFFRMGTNLTLTLGFLGLLLSVVGIYGVISYSASQRTHEIGVRMAMGASRGDILTMVLKQGFSLMGFGVVAGLALTLVVVRSVSSLLLGVSPTDPLTLVAVTALLSVIGLAASLIPARRAMKVEPLAALKYE